MKYDSENLWCSGENKLTTEEVFESIEGYVEKGGIVYV